MSFSRHQRSINPVGFLNRGPGAWLLGPRPLTVSMSRSRLFLGGSLSSGARLRFTGCAQNALEWSCRSKFSQRTANRVLTVCVSLGGKRKLLPPTAVLHRDALFMFCTTPPPEPTLTTTELTVCDEDTVIGAV